MTQKVIQIGSSAGVTLSKETLKKLGLKIGDQVKVEVDDKNRVVSVRASKIRRNKEVSDWTEKFIERYRPALKELAKK